MDCNQDPAHGRFARLLRLILWSDFQEVEHHFVVFSEAEMKGVGLLFHALDLLQVFLEDLGEGEESEVDNPPAEACVLQEFIRAQLA